MIAAIRTARADDRGIIWGLGAHVIKTGLSPVVIDLMERGFVSALATNGAGVIHDFEVALSGGTSEDVEEALGPGRFGMADETGRLLNAAINDGVAEGLGLGQAVGRHLLQMNPPHASLSILAAAARLDIPVTVHVALGTDIIHMHQDASGARLGEGSLRDFRYFCSSVARLAGGVYLNCGSAVVLPEVFLKAVALARNRGASLDGLTTVNLDFARLYRPQTNVVSRPVAGVGKGIFPDGPPRDHDSPAGRRAHRARMSHAKIESSGGVAQLVRARGSYPRCPGFKSLHRHHFCPRKSGNHGQRMIWRSADPGVR